MENRIKLLKCPDCGHMVSIHANFCPNCGCKISYIIDCHNREVLERRKRMQSIQEPEPVREKETRYVIKDKDTNTYFKGFHEVRNYETYRESYGEQMSSFVKNRVPDFTLRVEDAYHFIVEESAIEKIKEISSVKPHLQVIKVIV